jgi:hypothetical protein
MTLNIWAMPSCTSPTSQPWAGTGPSPSLLLDVGHVRAVALAKRAGLEVDVELGDDEQRQALGAGLRAVGSGEHQVDDVVAQVVLGRGDEPLDAGDVPGAVGLLHGLGGAGADVGARVGLGEHHRGAPLVLEHELGQALLVAGAQLVENGGEGRTRAVHEDGRVGAEHHLEGRPGEDVRGAEAAEVLGQVEAVPLAVLDRLDRLLERLGQRHRVRGRVEDRRVAVGVDERRGDGALGELADLGKHTARGVGVHLLERARAEPVLRVEELEQVELEVPQVGGVVAHAVGSRASVLVGGESTRYSPVTNVITHR